jgi:hypothetical protein
VLIFSGIQDSRYYRRIAGLALDKKADIFSGYQEFLKKGSNHYIWMLPFGLMGKHSY